MKKVEAFTLRNDRNQNVLKKDLLDWKDALNPNNDIFGPVITYSWPVGEQDFEAPYNGYWCELPDASGFICFERERKSDNCVLLDAYGEKRIRLSVPWQLTRHRNPDSGERGQ